MAATSSERILYASKSRKWNSTQNYKFPTEFPTEHAENLKWIRKTEEASARTRAHEDLIHATEKSQQDANGEIGRNEQQKKSDGKGKWIIIWIVGVIVAMRAWQRYNESDRL